MQGISIIICEIDQVVYNVCEVVKKTFLKDLNEELFPLQFTIDLEEFVRLFTDDIFCLIEYPYVDKVYRDSYYNYFSSKHYSYSRDCIRISLFKNKITEEMLFSAVEDESLNNQYLGYFVIRPTKSATLGRDFISPKAYKISDFELCLTSKVISVLGVQLNTRAFPHSTQDEEVMLCAETTVWTIMEYFGHRYTEYCPVSPSKIHQKLNHIAAQRQVPSSGLTMDEISYALKEFGFGTFSYSKSSINDEIYDILKIYVDSGIPVVVGLDDKEHQHAIVAIGRKLNSVVFDERKMLTDPNGQLYFDLSKLECELVYQDDNLPPYQISKPENIGDYYISAGKNYGAGYQIDSLVVPLYSKIYLEALSAKPLAHSILTDRLLGYSFQSKYILRFFLTSSRSFKRHVKALQSIDLTLKKQLLLTRMPKFVWCAEVYATEANYLREEVAGLLLLDATEANSVGLDALIFAGYPDKVLVFDNNNLLILRLAFEDYKPYHNLTCLKP